MEEYLQPAVYVHNVTPITGTKNIDPFYLVFGRHAPSPVVLSMELPPSPLTRDDYATYLVCRMHKAKKEFNAIKNELCHSQRLYYDKNACFIDIPIGKQVFVCQPPPTSQSKELAIRFIHRYEGPYTVVEHVHGRSDLLKLLHQFTVKNFLW